MALFGKVSRQIKGRMKFLNEIQFNKHVSISPERYSLIEFFKQRPALNAVLAAAYTDADATAAANTAISLAKQVANKDFEVLGTNMTTALATFSAISAGIVLTTAGADNDQAIVTPHLDTNQSAWLNILWGTENQVVFETAITVGPDITNGVLLFAGLKLTNTPVIATDDDQVFLRFSTDDSDTNWQLEYSIGGVDVAIDTGVAVAINTEYRIKIAIDADRIARVYINDEFVGKTTALTNDIDLIPYVGIQALNGAAEYMTVHYAKISRILFE